jgi:phage-related protein
VADAQYVIDIAANMPDGAATIAELDRLTETLTGAGKNSDGFQAAIKRLSSELDTAKAAADAANAALGVGADQYKVLERDALRAGKALETAQSKGRFDPRIARAAAEAQAALSAYSGTIEKLEKESADASAEQARLAGALSKVQKLASHVDQRNQMLNQRYEKLGQIAQFLPGPLGRVGGAALRGAKAHHELGVAVGTSTATMLAGVAAATVAAAAVVALTAAMVAGTAAAFGYAASQADAARSAGLAREAFAVLSPETGAAVASFDAVKEATGLTDQALTGLTKSLRAAGVEAGDMPEALLAAAKAEAALGQGGASEFIQSIQEGERSVQSFAKEAESKFGGIVAQQLRGLTAQGKRFDSVWSKLFTGVNLDPVLDAVALLVGMFEKGHPLADTFGFAITSAFDAVAKYAVPAAQMVEAFALGFAIQALKMYIAIKPLLGGLGEVVAWVGAAEAAGKLFAVALVTIGVALSPLVLAATLLGAALAVVVTGIGAVVYGLFMMGYYAGQALMALGGLIANVLTMGYDLGANLLQGLVNGIVAFVPAVITAISGAVTSAIDTAKELLGIHSPSRVFAEIGTHTAEGFVQGVEDGEPAAEGSMARLVGNGVESAASSASTAPAQGSASRGKASIDFSGATFNFHGVADAETARDKFGELLTMILEDDATSLAGAAT